MKECQIFQHQLIGKRVEVTIGAKSGLTGVVIGRGENRRWRVRCDTNMGSKQLTLSKSHFKEIKTLDGIPEVESFGNEDLSMTMTSTDTDGMTPPPSTHDGGSLESSPSGPRSAPCTSSVAPTMDQICSARASGTIRARASGTRSLTCRRRAAT